MSLPMAKAKKQVQNISLDIKKVKNQTISSPA